MRRFILYITFVYICMNQVLYAQDMKIDGYRGIWYKSFQQQGPGISLSGGMATFSPRHNPAAIYVPKVKKTFFVYGGTVNGDVNHLLIMASYFDHRLNTVPKPVVVLDKMGVSEPYDNASLAIDPSGYLWVYVSGWGRTRPGLVFKSREPWSVNGFEKISEYEMISPQPYFSNEKGPLVCYSKATGGREIYFSAGFNSDLNKINTRLAAFGGHSKISASLNQKLVIAFNYFPDGNLLKQTNLYFIQTEDYGESWETINGNSLTMPLTAPENDALIWDLKSQGRQIYLNDINFERNGNPVILAVVTKNAIQGTDQAIGEWVIVRRKENKWNTVAVCEANNINDAGALYIDKDSWKIIGPTENGEQKNVTGGEVALWESKDNGSSWSKTTDITVQSVYNHSFVKRPLNASDKFFAFWSDGNAETPSLSKLYFTNSRGTKVWVMPYQMLQENEVPLRIR